MNTEAIVVAVGLGVNLLTIVGVAIKLSSKFAAVETLLNHVIKNHIPHIYREISELRKLITDHITKDSPPS